MDKSTLPSSYHPFSLPEKSKHAKCEENKQAPPYSISEFRKKVHHLHVELENTHVSKTLISPNITLEQYISIIRIWHKTWQAIENELMQFDNSSIRKHYIPEPRAHLLAEDLNYLKKANTAPINSSIPQTDNSFGSWLGIAYVLQGSKLGSKVISRHLDCQLGLNQTNGASFFSSEPKENQVNWPAWTVWFNKNIGNSDNYYHAMNAAMTVFTFCIQVFNRAVIPNENRTHDSVER